MEAGEAESTDCVDRHTFFITRSGYSAEADRLRAHHASAPAPATANQDSYGGVAGQKVILRKHLHQLLAPVAGLRSTGRQVWGREEQALEAPQKGSWSLVEAPKGASRLVEPVQPRPAPFRTCGTAYR